MQKLILAIVLASSIVDQGSPGRQGPWPVYFVTLPDGGGGGALWADAGAGNIAPSPQAGVLVGGQKVTVGSGATTELAFWNSSSALAGDPNLTWDGLGNLKLDTVAGGLQDGSIGGCFGFPDGGGICLGTQYGAGVGCFGVEIIDVSNADGSNVQTEFQYNACTNILESIAQLKVDAALTAAGSLAVPYPALINMSSGGSAREVLTADAMNRGASDDYPGLQVVENGGPMSGRIGAVDGTGYDFYVTGNASVGPFGASYILDSTAGDGIVLHLNQAPGTGGFEWLSLPSGGTLTPVATQLMKLDTETGNLHVNGTISSAGTAVAKTTDLRSYAVVTGTPTTATVGATLVQGLFSAPSAGVPARFAFHVNTAGLGAGSVTISLFDSTTSASTGAATFGCTATGDQSLAVTSPTAWAANDAVELRIDDSACTAANGPVGIPSATVQWQ